MIRLFFAPALLGLVALGCSRDRSDTGTTRDTLATPVGTVGIPDTTPKAGPAAGESVSVPSTPKTPSTPNAPAPDVANAPAPAKPAPVTPAPVPPSTPDTPPAKPNIHPQPIREPPAVPKDGATPDTQPAGNAPLRDAYHQAPRDTVSPVVYNGWKQFNLNCSRCHGEDVLGTTIAPHLLVSLKPDGPINTRELFMTTVCHGRPQKGMPAWCSLGMDTTKIGQIYAYVKGRSDGKVGPGRPAVRP